MSPDLLPVGVEPWFAAVLVAVSFLTSAITAAVGIGGGVALLAVMASGLPVAALIPIHGIVQLGSNSGRAFVLRSHIAWRFVVLLSAGTVIGAVIGGLLVVRLPDAWLKLAVGAFVLWSVWGAKPRVGRGDGPVIVLGGVISAVLSMFIGASGPFVAALVGVRDYVRQTVVATHAACMIVQHCLKVVVFGVLGFAFGPWIWLIVAMIAAGFLGTLAGTRLLHRLPEERFKLAFSADPEPFGPVADTQRPARPSDLNR